MRGLNKLFAALIVGAFLALPASALAQSSSGGYNQPGGVVQDQIQAKPARDETKVTPPQAVTQAPPAKSTSGQLPFTGFDLALVVGAGCVLLLMGFGIRRLTQPSGLA